MLRNDQTQASQIAEGPLVGELAEIQRLVSFLLDADTTKKLASTSHTLFSHLTTYDAWRPKFIAIGCEPQIIDAFAAKKLISNYQKFYFDLVNVKEKSKRLGSILQGFASSLDGLILLTDHQKEIENIVGTMPTDRLVYALSLAAFNGSVEAMNLIASKMQKLNVSDVYGFNVWHYAFLSESEVAQDWALKCGIDPLSVTGNGYNILHLSACIDSVAGMDKAIKLGIDPMSTTKGGMNAFHCAASRGSVAAMDKAIALGIDFKAYSLSKKTSLHFAVMSNSAAAIAKVLALGIDPRSVDDHLCTAFHYACSVEAIKTLVPLFTRDELDAFSREVALTQVMVADTKTVFFLRRIFFEQSIDFSPQSIVRSPMIAKLKAPWLIPIEQVVEQTEPTGVKCLEPAPAPKLSL